MAKKRNGVVKFTARQTFINAIVKLIQLDIKDLNDNNIHKVVRNPLIINAINLDRINIGLLLMPVVFKPLPQNVFIALSSSGVFYVNTAFEGQVPFTVEKLVHLLYKMYIGGVVRYRYTWYQEYYPFIREQKYVHSNKIETYIHIEEDVLSEPIVYINDELNRKKPISVKLDLGSIIDGYPRPWEENLTQPRYEFYSEVSKIFELPQERKAIGSQYNDLCIELYRMILKEWSVFYARPIVLISFDYPSSEITQYLQTLIMDANITGYNYEYKLHNICISNELISMINYDIYLIYHDAYAEIGQYLADLDAERQKQLGALLIDTNAIVIIVINNKQQNVLLHNLKDTPLVNILYNYAVSTSPFSIIINCHAVEGEDRYHINEVQYFRHGFMEVPEFCI